MDFKKYYSIENSYRTKFLNKITEEGHSGAEFVVTEKVHGANFSFWSDATHTRCAKRSGFIGESEKFYNFQPVLKRYYQQMRDLFTDLQESRGAQSVAVFGELFGGKYDHPDVPKVPNESTVQKEVQYSPRQDFIAFDLMVDGLLQPVDETVALLKKHGIPQIPILFRGSLEQCLQYPNDFVTFIPRLFELPSIEGNITEGTVIKPSMPIFLWSGERLILKNKNAKFRETEDREPKKLKDTPKMTESAKAALSLAQTYITENRLRNVLSKIGTIEKTDFGKVMGLYTADIIEDLMKDSETIMESLDKSERKNVTKMIGQRAATMLRSNWLNIVDGTY